jgi:hypothetical protein
MDAGRWRLCWRSRRCPWDGANPFHCTVQNAGFGTKVPDPGADPYCVSFNKTRQNISQLGLLDFLLKEPARVAAATPKCFYFQEDHWRGSVVQSDASSVLYEFCVTGGGALLAGEPGDRSGTLGSGTSARTVVLLTSSRAFVLGGPDGRSVTVGSRAGALTRALHGAHRIARVDGIAVMRRGNLLAGVRSGRVVYLGAYSTRSITSRRALVGYLRRAI